jgi:cell division septum initiation protein DivIVA
MSVPSEEEPPTACSYTQTQLLGPAAAALLTKPVGPAEAVCRRCKLVVGDHEELTSPAGPSETGSAAKAKHTPLWAVGTLTSRVLAEPLELDTILLLATEKPGEMKKFTAQTTVATRKSGRTTRGCADPFEQLRMTKRLLEIIAARMAVTLATQDAPPMLALSDVLKEANLEDLDHTQWSALLSVVSLKAVGLGVLIARWSEEMKSGRHTESSVQVRTPDTGVTKYEDWFKATRRDDAEAGAAFFEALFNASTLAEIRAKADLSVDFLVGAAIAGHGFDKRSGDLARLWKELTRRDGLARDVLAETRKDEVKAAKDARKKTQEDERAERQAQILATGHREQLAGSKRRRTEKEADAGGAPATPVKGTTRKPNVSNADVKAKERKAVLALAPADRTKNQCRSHGLCLACKEQGHLAANCPSRTKKQTTAAAAAESDDEP